MYSITKKLKWIIPSTISIATIVSSSFLIASCSSLNNENNNTLNVSIISTNDVHGRLISNEKSKEAGLEALSGWLKTQKYDLLLDAGDLTQGTSLSDTDKGKTIANVAKIMGYDAIAVGNHDFDFGLDNILNIAKNINPDFLSANVRYKSNNNRLFTAQKIKVLDNGLKVGIIGLTTPETAYKTHPNNVKDIKFTNMLNETKNEIEILKKQGINFIVLVAHVGEYDTIPLAKALNDDIDLIIDGHSQKDILENINNKTYIIQAGEYTKAVRKTKIEFNHKTGYITKFNSDLILSDQILPFINQAKPEITNMINNLKNIQQEEFKEVVINNNPIKLNGERNQVRYRETNLGNLVADAFYKKAKETVIDLDFAFTNSGGIRDSINQGVVTKKETYDVFPFGNKLVVQEAKGSVIKQVFDKARVSNNGSGAFLQISKELKLIQKNENEWVYLIFNNKINNYEPLDLEKTYKFATNDFTAAGGDDYKMLIGLNELYSGYDAKIVLEEYLKYLSNNLSEFNNYKIEFPRSRWVYINESTGPNIY